MHQALNRQSSTEAASVMTSLFPIEHERSTILDRLLRSAELANSIAPNAWAVTLFPDSFRLNVGQVEVYVAFSGGFFLCCSASTASAPFNTDAFRPSKYKSVPDPQCQFHGIPADLRVLPKEVEQAHAKFIDSAARGPSSGKPRKGTRFGNSHSEGLIAFARQVVQRSITEMREGKRGGIRSEE
jgi:hypothetical protein